MMTHLSNKTIETLVETVDLQVSQAQIEQFGLYKQLLLTWNEKINLTAVRTPQGIEEVHFLDSLSTLLVTGSLENCSLIDIGTGAGFPGLPLKIIFPSLKLTLVESIQKKCRFLQEVVDQLNLESVTILSERAEQLGRDAAHREQYDWVMARAVADLNVLLEYLVPFAKVGGHILAMKGPESPNELTSAQNAMGLLGVNLVSKEKVPTLISGEKARFLMLFEKVSETAVKYPRRPGIPLKRPL